MTTPIETLRRLLAISEQLAAANDALLKLSADLEREATNDHNGDVRAVTHAALAVSLRPSTLELFETFWKSRPPRTGVDPKAPARDVWMRLKPTPAQAMQITAAIIAQHENVDPEFRPHTRTWLRQHRWEDSVGAVQLGAVGKVELAKGKGLTRKSSEVLLGLGADVEEREFRS